jgi:hypothetical protein
MQSQLDVDDALIAQFLGPRYRGRRFLRFAELVDLGVVDNRVSLKNWIAAGAFPAGVKIPGSAGKTLVWMAIEVARHIAQRVAERDASFDPDGMASRAAAHEQDSFCCSERREPPRQERLVSCLRAGQVTTARS